MKVDQLPYVETEAVQGIYEGSSLLKEILYLFVQRQYLTHCVVLVFIMKCLHVFE